MLKERRTKNKVRRAAQDTPGTNGRVIDFDHLNRHKRTHATILCV
jgi:hypothetical protein